MKKISAWIFSARPLFFAAFVMTAAPTLLRADGPIDPGLLLLESFSSSCASRGPFSQRTLNETVALKRIIETLKDDAACRGLQPIFSSLIHINSQLSFLQNGLEGDREADLDAYANRLSYAINQTSDPELKTGLSAEYIRALFERITLSKTQKQESRLRIHQTVNDLTTYLESIQKDFADQQLCFQNHKSLPIQLAGHLLSVSGAFFDPTLNLALSLSGRLIATAFSFFNDLRFNKKIRDYQMTTLQAGLGCAMEALEQTVCDIQDRRQMIGVVQNYRRQESVPRLWKGYELYTREFQVFRDFVLKVEAGSPASSDQQADRRAKFRKSEGDFNAIIEMAYGRIGEAKIEIAFPGQTPEQKKNILRNLLHFLSEILLDSDIVRVVIPDGRLSTLLWLRIGDPRPVEEIVNDGGRFFKSYDTIIDELNLEKSIFQVRDAVSNLSFSSIEKQLEIILGLSRERLALERELRLITDSQGALNSWALKGVNGMSPELISLQIIDYLQGLELDWRENPQWFDSVESQRDQLLLVINTRDRFDQLVRIIRGPIAEEADLKQVYGEKMQRIYKLLNLQERDQFIGDRFYSIVTLDLEKRLRAGLLSDRKALNDLVGISQERLLKTMTPAGVARLEPLKEDLDDAEPYALSNMLHFFKHYRGVMAEVLSSMDDLAKVFKQKPNGSIYRKMAKLCTLALNDPQILSDSKLLAACEGRVLGLAEDMGPVVDLNQVPIQVVFREKDILFQSPEERLCSYRRFRNRLELQEDVLRHRPKQKTQVLKLESQRRDFPSRPPFSILFDEFSSDFDLRFSYFP